MAEEKEGVSASSEHKTREMDGKKNYGRRKQPSDMIRESEEFFEVDKIVGMTKINGKERYKVRWVGYPSSNDTWEPRENLLPCIEMVEDFERDRQRLKKRRAEERRIRKSQRHDPLAMMEGRHVPGTALTDDKRLSSTTMTTPTTTTTTTTKSLTTASYVNDIEAIEDPLVANGSRNISSISNCGLLGQPQPTTLKDTFWKDLEEGKVDLFETDMYSKVKAQGRASRPKSFKNVFNKQSERLRGNNSQSTKKSSSKGNRKQNILAKYYSQRRIRTNHLWKSSEKNPYSFGPRTENSSLVNKNGDTSLIDSTNNNDSIVTEDWDYVVDRKSPMIEPCDLNRMDCDTKSSISYSTTDNNCTGRQFMYQRNITAQMPQGCQPNLKDSPPSLQQIDCAVNEGAESDQSSKSQITCDTSSQNCDCDNKSSPSSSPSSALRLQNLKDPTHSLAKKRRTRLRPNRNIVISYSSKRKKTKFHTLHASPKSTTRSTMNLLPPEKSTCNIFAMGESSVDSGVSSLRTETETEMDSNSPGLESIASTVSVSRSMTPQDTGSVCLLEDDHVNPDCFTMPLETSAISSCQLVLPCDIGTDLKIPADDKSGVDTRCSTKTKDCPSTLESCSETNSEQKQTIHYNPMGGYSLSDQPFGSYSNNKNSLGPSSRWELSALLKIHNPLNSIRNKIIRHFFDNTSAEELAGFCTSHSRPERSRNAESSSPPQAKKARLSNNVIQISKDEFVQSVLAGDYDRLKSALRGDRFYYDLESPNADGYTLIMQSILRGFNDITLLLALAGAQLDKSLSNGETALMLACTRGDAAAVEVLVKLGANLERYTTNRETALIKAIYGGNLQIVKLLLDHGANLAFQNRDNLNSLDLVRSNPSLQGMREILTTFHDKYMSQMKDCINAWLKGEHELVTEVFTTQCMALARGRKVQVCFRQYQRECERYEAYLLFLVHVHDIGAAHIGCRLKGESVVTNVCLNGVTERQISLPSKFVTSFRNLRYGDNTLLIDIKPDAKMTLLVSAYRVRRKTS